jgi:RNA polymerase sigma-70 factor (ECF subfamily)
VADGGGKEAELLDRQPSEGPTDAALLARAKGGDRAALGDLYDRHATPAYSLACRVVGVTSAADVVHDAFVALMEKPATFDPSLGTFRAWFMTAVHHRCLNVLRGNRAVADEEALADVPDPGVEPPDAIVRQLRDAAVREALQLLSAEQREVLVLAYYSGLSQSGVAARLGVPLGTVKARMRRGLIALRGLLHGEAAPVDEGTEL